jgi:hypothetical protein
MINEALYKAVETVLTKYGESITAAIKSNLQNKNSLSTGNLYNSIQFHISFFSQTVSLGILAEDYLKWVDQGRKPGKKPPLSEILQWVKTKRLASKGLPEKKIQGLPEKQKAIAFLIQKSIGLKGTKPKHVVADALKEAEKTLYIEIGTAINSVIGTDLTQALKDGATGNKYVSIKTYTRT